MNNKNKNKLETFRKYNKEKKNRKNIPQREKNITKEYNVSMNLNNLTNQKKKAQERYNNPE